METVATSLEFSNFDIDNAMNAQYSVKATNGTLKWKFKQTASTQNREACKLVHKPSLMGGFVLAKIPKTVSL